MKIHLGSTVKVTKSNMDCSYWKKGDIFTVIRIEGNKIYGHKMGRLEDNWISRKWLVAKGGKVKKTKLPSLYISYNGDNEDYTLYSTLSSAVKGASNKEFDEDVVIADVCEDASNALKLNTETIYKVSIKPAKSIKTCSCGNSYVVKEKRRKRYKRRKK
ncbi:hypothetical protein LCGC14_2504650 [marine sediment metagenome]|uniref:Uncharacterized protein n=1 Tax=marine sediment metagenome TaxID=412755 RepID=A0A0F9BNW5_9ZZZZ